VAVAGVLTGRLRSPVLAHLPGGDLRIAWEGGGAGVLMSGPAVEVFEGKLDLGAWPRGGREDRA
jgi:diaminopimelate epimerase